MMELTIPGRIKDILLDVQKYLHLLEDVQMDGVLQAERERLLKHITNQLKTPISEEIITDEYLPMDRNSQDNDKSMYQDPIYEGPEGTSDDESLKKHNIEPFTNETLPLEESVEHLSYQDALNKSTKHGQLECKKNKRNRRILGVLKSLCKMYAVLVENWLLLYNGESDVNPTLSINLDGYHVTECLTPTFKDAKRKDFWFEIKDEKGEKENHQFYAPTNKDMEQWVAAIENLTNNKQLTIKQQTLSRKLPVPPSNPIFPSDIPSTIADNDEALYEYDNESIYEEVEHTNINNDIRDTFLNLEYDSPRKTQFDNDQKHSTFIPPAPPIPAIQGYAKITSEQELSNSSSNKETLSNDSSLSRKNSLCQSSPLVKAPSTELPVLFPKAPAIPPPPIPKVPALQKRPKPAVPEKPKMNNMASINASRARTLAMNPIQNKRVIEELESKLVNQISRA